MLENFFPPKALVRGIAKATNAVLIIQWAHHNTLSKEWNATRPDGCATVHVLRYWLSVVVADDEPRTAVELLQAAKAACKGHEHIVIDVVLRQKIALRRLKYHTGAFAAIYRLGHALHNSDKKHFPKPGYARNDKTQMPLRPIENIW